MKNRMREYASEMLERAEYRQVIQPYAWATTRTAAKFRKPYAYVLRVLDWA